MKILHQNIHADEVLGEFPCRSSLLESRNRFFQACLWATRPALHRTVYGNAVARHQARKAGLARCGHHSFAFSASLVNVFGTLMRPSFRHRRARAFPNFAQWRMTVRPCKAAPVCCVPRVDCWRLAKAHCSGVRNRERWNTRAQQLVRDLELARVRAQQHVPSGARCDICDPMPRP